MSFLKPTREELSRHEAGHAYASASLNRDDDPDEVGLARDEHGWRGWCKRPTIFHLSGTTIASQDEKVRPYLAWQAMAEIVVAQAGPLAEFRFRERSPARALHLLDVNAEAFLSPATGDRDGDFQRIRTTMACLDPVDPAAVFRRLLTVADDILTANWSKINHLALQLLKRKVIAGEELWDLLERRPAVEIVFDPSPSQEAADLGGRADSSSVDTGSNPSSKNHRPSREALRVY